MEDIWISKAINKRDDWKGVGKPETEFLDSLSCAWKDIQISWKRLNETLILSINMWLIFKSNNYQLSACLVISSKFYLFMLHFCTKIRQFKLLFKFFKFLSFHTKNLVLFVFIIRLRISINLKFQTCTYHRSYP